MSAGAGAKPKHLWDHIQAAANARDVHCPSPITAWQQEKVTIG
jgi:hypothetical protein